MTKIHHGRAVAVLLAALLAVLALAPIARAQTVGTSSFPGSTADIAFVTTRDEGNENRVGGGSDKMSWRRHVLTRAGEVLEAPIGGQRMRVNIHD